MSEQTYTVEAVHGTEPKPDKGYGEMQQIKMTLAGEGRVSWYTKRQTALPQPGAQLEGTVEDSEYGKKFKKAKTQMGFGGGGGFRMDPAKDRRITRMASQERALRYMVARGITDFKLDDDFRKVIDWFARDADAAGQA
jgi:hypothetical protein